MAHGLVLSEIAVLRLLVVTSRVSVLLKIDHPHVVGEVLLRAIAKQMDLPAVEPDASSPPSLSDEELRGYGLPDGWEDL